MIYGVKEINNIPSEIDEGVDNKEIDREWIDQILSFNIIPPIEGLEIIQIQLNKNNSLYVLKIPKSFRDPHQAPDKKYYKRYNFRCSPMDHYEIEDLRNRKFQLPPPLVNVDIDSEGFIFKLIVENIGKQVAHQVKFSFSDGFKWPRGSLPAALEKGMKYFPPARKFSYPYASSIGEGSQVEKVFEVRISYLHPQNRNRINENFHFDLNDYLGTSIKKDSLKEIVKSLEKLSDIEKSIRET